MVADILDRFGMVAKKDLSQLQLSRGQQQLVGIARAIIDNLNYYWLMNPLVTCTPIRER